jgi:predicted acyltransferase
MNEQTLKLSDRLVSIDALRGLAMFLILAIDIGGAPVFQTFTKLLGENFANAASDQFNYGFVEGLRLCFIAMPMFLFVVGLAIPFSLNNRLLLKDKKRIYLHIIKRFLILFILGLVAGGHLLHLKFESMPVYNNVLEYISIGYLVCAILVLNTNTLVQYILAGGLLLLYWAIFLFIPVPGWQGEIFSGEMNLAIYIDNVVLGPHHHPGSWQVLATISFIANMLLGVLMGQLLKSTRDKKYKLKMLFIFGSALLVTGMIWGLFFPVVRSLWSSSFVLETCGITTLLLAVFYWLIDIRGYKKWAFFFIVFGVNSIAIYMMAHMFDFRQIGNIFVVMWLIMYWMYIKKTFIKI